MPKRRPEPDPVHPGPAYLDPAHMLEVRHMAHRSGVPAAEVMRNIAVTGGAELGSMTLDGITAVTPDFDAELVGLLAYEQAMDEQCRERQGQGDDQ